MVLLLLADLATMVLLRQIPGCLLQYLVFAFLWRSQQEVRGLDQLAERMCPASIAERVWGVSLTRRSTY